MRFTLIPTYVPCIAIHASNIACMSKDDADQTEFTFKFHHCNIREYQTLVLVMWLHAEVRVFIKLV